MDCWRHEEIIKGYFEFLEFVLKIGKADLKLNESNIDSLWKMFVTQAICQEETNFFYLQLIKRPAKPKR